MIEHETRMKVKMSFYINVSTESHPEDIEDDTMYDIIAPVLQQHIQELGEDDVKLLIDAVEYDVIKMFDDGEEVK